MFNVQLSILIPTIPSRLPEAVLKYNKYLKLIGKKRIEVILYCDNKKISIGEKREILKNSCNGKYFIYADDDDDLTSISEIYKATFQEVDVIDFKIKCRNDDGSKYIVTCQLGNEIEHNTKDGRYMNCKRPPFHNSAWHNKFKKFSFPFINYSEDWEFIKQCLAEAKTEVFINKVLFHYNFNPSVTEASTESNEHWTNPNNS